MKNEEMYKVDIEVGKQVVAVIEVIAKNPDEARERVLTKIKFNVKKY